MVGQYVMAWHFFIPLFVLGFDIHTGLHIFFCYFEHYTMAQFFCEMRPFRSHFLFLTKCSQLPDFLGGACTCSCEGGCLRSNKGPWNQMMTVCLFEHVLLVIWYCMIQVIIKLLFQSDNLSESALMETGHLSNENLACQVMQFLQVIAMVPNHNY